MGIVGSLFQGIFGSNAASKTATVEANASTHAADLQKQAADQALAFNKQQYGNSLSLLSPFYNSGVAANSRLDYLMGLTPDQGLPPGVVNPNPPAPSRTLDASTFDPGSLADLRALRAGNGSGIRPFTAEGGTAPFNRLSAMAPQSSTVGMTGAPGEVAQTGNAGAIQPGATGQPGSILNSIIQGEGGTPGGVVNATTNQGGTGQVARTDGGGIPSAGQDPNSFGSLAQGWNKTFQSPTDVTEQNDPGYQFRLQQGQNALQNSAAARGGLLSGGTAKALNDYAQGSASSEYGNVYNRALQNYNTNYNTFTNDQTNLFNRLSTLSGQGQVSANNLSNAGVSTANTNANIGLSSAGQIGDSLQNAANATGTGYINSANAINGAFKSGTNSLASLLAMFGGG